MGNPLFVSVSDFVFGLFLVFFSGEPEQFKSLFYERFVDDILSIFDPSMFPYHYKSAIVEGFIDYFHTFAKSREMKRQIGPKYPELLPLIVLIVNLCS